MTSLNLTPEPEIITWPAGHYIYIEKTGPFMQSAPAAWTALHSIIPTIEGKNKISKYLSMFKIGEGDSNIYHAGLEIEKEPTEIPAGMKYKLFPGGKYAKFKLIGPYDHLPEACGRAFGIVKEKNIPQRDDFNIEYYLNDPKVTPKEQLGTEILIAIQ